MVKWYDQFFAVMFADMMITFAHSAYAASEISIVNTLLFMAMIYVAYDCWINTYCKFRLTMELKR